MRETNDERLVWVDLEMTGLDVTRERILEIATIVTDAQLEIVAEGPELVLHQSEEILGAMDDWNKKHHGQSGLIDRARASTIDDAKAEELTLDFLRQHVGAGKAQLAGNSIHQDRLFLARYMPTLESYIHYRNVDVSTIKELVKRWYPAAYEGRPTKKGSHRALDDIRESIEELRYYRKTVFR